MSALNGQRKATGADLLDEVLDYFERFVSFPSESAAVAVTLWAAHAHSLETWVSTPRLALLSPEPQSGKTRTLELLETLCPRPLLASSCTPAVMARTIDSGQVITVLFDEIDAVFGGKASEHEELRSLLNTGHRPGAGYWRMVGEGKEMVAKGFSTYAATALAGLGDLPDTIMQRSIVIRMRRRAPDEYVQPFRYREHAPEGEALRDRLAAWLAAWPDLLEAARPEMPDGVTDRPADVWEPLLAVADLAEGDWPARARAACVELVKAAVSVDAGSLGLRLLADLRVVFGDDDRLTTDEVLRRLVALDEAPWGDLRGRPLDPRGLARRLGHYGVRPKVLRVGDATPRGYLREDLHDSWTRYLPPTPSGKSATSATSATSEETCRSATHGRVALPVRVADASATSQLSATDDQALTCGVADVADVADFQRGVPTVTDDPPAPPPCSTCGLPLDGPLGRAERWHDSHPACDPRAVVSR